MGGGRTHADSHFRFFFFQISLRVERWGAEARKHAENPDADRVGVLWRMKVDKRVQVWRTLGRFQEVEELELGGELFCGCPLGVEELFMLLPEGATALAGLDQLFLSHCANQVDDGFLRALATVGCGENLSTLTLSC